jgi:hypothetical protein
MLESSAVGILYQEFTTWERYPNSNISLANLLLDSNSARSPAPTSTGLLGTLPSSSAALLLLSNSAFSSSLSGSPAANSAPRGLPEPSSAVSTVSFALDFRLARCWPYQNANAMRPMIRHAPSAAPTPIPALHLL